MFDFLKKKGNDNKSLRDHLSLYPGWFLYDEAIKSLNCTVSNNEYLAPIAIQTTFKTEYITWSHNYKSFLKDGISIPKKYFEEKTSAIDLLEIATEKGHYDAPFVLFLIYEFGIDKLTDWQQHTVFEMENNRDREKAAVYKELAKQRNSPLVKAYEWIEHNVKVKEGLPVERWELTIASMISGKKETDEILGVFETKFSQLGTFVLSALAQYDSSYCAGFLALMLGSILKHKEDRSESFANMESYFKYSDKDINDAFFAVANRLLKKSSRR